MQSVTVGIVAAAVVAQRLHSSNTDTAIDEALAPLSDPLVAADPAEIARLRNDLVAVVSAEALFVLTDLAGLAPQEAIASLVRTATTVTESALTPAPATPAALEDA